MLGGKTRARFVAGKTENHLSLRSTNTVKMGDMLLERPDDGITIPQAAERIGVDAQTVRNWIRTGKLPATRWGPEGAKIIRVDPADLDGLGPRPVTTPPAASPPSSS